MHGAQFAQQAHQPFPSHRGFFGLPAGALGQHVEFAAVFKQLHINRIANLFPRQIEPFLFVPFDSYLYAVDILGYTFMSVATLFAAPVFTEKGLQRVARRFLVANGVLAPFLALQMYFHPLIWIASLWAVTFPGCTWTLAILFRRAQITDRRL